VKGKLILVPTPIDEENLLDSHTKDLLLKACAKGSIFAIEDLKPGRRRWLRYGLPRENVEEFILYNEHTRSESIDTLMKHLHAGKDVYLMSDAGLPAFCDPGRLLVDRAHKERIQVTATPFSNSISLAIALSGYPHERFVFEGFIPVKDPARAESLKLIASEARPVVLMETPYRLSKLLSELDQYLGSREICLAVELGMSTEEVLRGSAKQLVQKFDGQKRPFVAVVSPKF
tara:strand:+ start:1089 stop:1781 length:693 start_codon:yes stop_codon:yes gene_type:complete